MGHLGPLGPTAGNDPSICLNLSVKYVILVLTESEKRHISPIFSPNKRSSALIIPKAMARELEIDRPCHVILEEKDGCILIRKLRIKDDD